MLKIVSIGLLSMISGAAFSQSNAFLPAKLKTTNTLKTPVGVAGQSNGVFIAKVAVAVDTTIRAAPTHAYLSIDFTDITGSNQMDILNGNNLFWIFDKAGKEIKIPLKVLFRAKAAMESNSSVDYSIRVPMRLKSDKNTYTVHYRWESKDKARNIDIVTSK